MKKLLDFFRLDDVDDEKDLEELLRRKEENGMARLCLEWFWH